jgi:hypothetical protein
LFERYDATPPKPATVRQWSQKYLKIYDRCIDDLNPDPHFKTARRKVIEHTFRWLEGLGESYFDR